jgi:predicted Zn-dependent protease
LNGTIEVIVSDSNVKKMNSLELSEKLHEYVTGTKITPEYKAQLAKKQKYTPAKFVPSCTTAYGSQLSNYMGAIKMAKPAVKYNFVLCQRYLEAKDSVSATMHMVEYIKSKKKLDDLNYAKMMLICENIEEMTSWEVEFLSDI